MMNTRRSGSDVLTSCPYCLTAELQIHNEVNHYMISVLNYWQKSDYFSLTFSVRCRYIHIYIVKRLDWVFDHI